MQYLGALILIILSTITLIAFFLAVALLFPRRVGLSQQSAEDMPGRSFLLGLINSLFITALIFGFIALAAGTGAKIFHFPAILLLTIYLIGLACGLVGLIQLTGTRLLPKASLNRQRILGALTLILGSLTPLVGWFGLFVYLCLLGLGSFIISLFRRETPLLPIESE